MAMLSPNRLQLDNDDLIIITFNRNISSLSSLHEYIGKLQEIDVLVQVIMQFNEEIYPERIRPARIEWIRSHSPIEIAINADLTFLGLVMVILLNHSVDIVKNYDRYRPGLITLKNDVVNKLMEVEGLALEQADVTARDLLVALDSFYEHASERWHNFARRVQEIHEFFCRMGECDIEFRYDEMVGS